MCSHVINVINVFFIFHFINILFIIIIHGITSSHTEIAAEASEEEMREHIEIAIGKIAGHVQVTRTGGCSGYTWQVTFVSVGGNKAPLKIVNSTLTGLGVSSKATTIKEGGILFGPLTGEFLQLAKEKPQVPTFYSFRRITTSWYFFKLVRRDCKNTKQLRKHLLDHSVELRKFVHLFWFLFMVFVIDP